MTEPEKWTKAQEQFHDIMERIGEVGSDLYIKGMADRARKPRGSKIEIAKAEEERKLRKVREAEGVLQSLRYVGSVIEMKCLNCGRGFGTNYMYNRHCSEECLRASLDKMGLKWDPEKSDEERFQAEPPLTISAPAWAALKKWAEQILGMEQPPEPEFSEVEIPVALPPVPLIPPVPHQRVTLKEMLKDLGLG